MNKADLFFRSYIVAALFQCCACALVDIQNEQVAIVNAHNDLRRQEEAANMRTLVWDNAVAVEAAKWTETCNYVHQYGVYGENLAMLWTSGSITPLTVVLRLTGKWAAEKPQSGGHYTQMIWATTTKVGCALSRCPTLRIGSKEIPNAFYFACFYLPPGNYRGQLPFIAGPRCSQCGSGMTCVEKLCTPQPALSAKSFANQAKKSAKSFANQAKLSAKSFADQAKKSEQSRFLGIFRERSDAV